MDNYNQDSSSDTSAITDLKFGVNVSDEELVRTIDTWMKECRTWHDWMLIRQDKSVAYYLGAQTDINDIPPYNSNTVYNRIFEATETIVPIITGTAHQFIAIPGQEDERSVERSKKIQKVLAKKYEDLEIQQKLENVTRDMILKRFGVLKWYWNIQSDDVDVKVVDARLILIPKLRMDANDPSLPYVMELQEYTREEIRAFFPDVDPDKLVFGRDAEYSAAPSFFNQNRAPAYQIIEVTTNEYICWKQGSTILKKIVSPYFDFEGEEEEKIVTKENGKVKTVKYRKFYNHLDYPVKNYIFFNPFTSGDSPVADASLAEIAIPIQDDINTQKRQIINNLIKMGNGQVYIDSDAIPKELADQITSEPGLVIEGKNLASENRIRREPGVALPQSHFANLQESVIAFDNVFGTHGAVRGASGDTTLGGQILNRQQDLSRIEQLTRTLNRGVARLADGLVQMMRLYYDADHLVKILGRDGAIEFIHFTRDDIDENVVINVKSGTPPVLDPVARYNQAIQLWQLNAIDPETLFERLEFADPQESAQKLFAWKSGQLLLESQLRQKEAMVGAEMKAKVGAEEGGNIENTNSVVARAEKSLGGGGAATITNPPKGSQGA